MHEYFDYTQAARKAGISPEDLATLREHIENIYPSQMLREMHLYTICTEIGQGKLTVEEALKPPSGELPDISNLRLGG
ncbi:MAG: hypothetical protein QGG42_21345 [Phycisphaerae bacterium]|jgi:hypothetical protein|nr:hypothetical protein [Phycisphaerae bacterium]